MVEGYNVSTIARLFNLTPRRVQQLARDGIIPKAARGRYELVGCVQGYVTYLQERVDGHLGDGTGTKPVSFESARFKRLQGDKLEMENKEHAGSLLSRDACLFAVQQIGATLVEALNGLGARICDQLAVEDNPARIKQILRDETNRTRASAEAGLLRVSAFDSTGADLTPEAQSAS